MIKFNSDEHNMAQPVFDKPTSCDCKTTKMPNTRSSARQAKETSVLIDDDVPAGDAVAFTSHTAQDIQKLLSDYDKKARLERDQERKDFLAVINNLCTTFGQAFAAKGPIGHDATSAPPTLPVAGRPTRDRPINVSGLDKMAHDMTLLDFDTWRTKWDDFCRVNHVDAYPQNQQTSAFRMALSTKMLQTVEKVLGINSETTLTPVEILNRMTTRILTGIRDQEARKKLLPMSYFPTLQQAVDTCRAEETACNNEPMIRQTADVNKIVSTSSSSSSGEKYGGK